MDRDELVKEIERVENALRKTSSYKLRHDYGKYLKRLYRELRYYDRQRYNYGKRTEFTTL